MKFTNVLLFKTADSAPSTVGKASRNLHLIFTDENGFDAWNRLRKNNIMSNTLKCPGFLLNQEWKIHLSRCSPVTNFCSANQFILLSQNLLYSVDINMITTIDARKRIGCIQTVHSYSSTWVAISQIGVMSLPIGLTLPSYTSLLIKITIHNPEPLRPPWYLTILREKLLTQLTNPRHLLFHLYQFMFVLI